MNCPYCRSSQTRKLHPHGFGVFSILLRPLSAHLPRADGHARPWSGDADRYRLPSRAVPATVQTQLARSRVQMFLIRGYELSHETVRDWEARFASLLADQVRRRRQGRIGRCWFVDETFHEMPGHCQAVFSCAVTNLSRLRRSLSSLIASYSLLCLYG
jgi:putative transposase